MIYGANIFMPRNHNLKIRMARNQTITEYTFTSTSIKIYYK